MDVTVRLHGIDDARLVADQLAVWFGDRADSDAPEADVVELVFHMGALRPPVEAASVALADLRVALVRWGHEAARITVEAGAVEDDGT